MADHSDYSSVANALVVKIHDIMQNGLPGTGFTGIPTMFAGSVPAALVPAAAGAFAQVAVDALDAHRATQLAGGATQAQL
jgi:hypothetical protein